MMLKKKPKITDIMLMIIVFVVVVGLAISTAYEHQYRKDLADSMMQVQKQLDKAKEKNRIHENKEIRTKAIENLFPSARGQIRIERIIKIKPAGDRIELTCSHGEHWSVKASALAQDLALEDGDKVLMLVDDNTTPKDKSDDIVLALYEGAYIGASNSKWVGEYGD